MEGAVLVQTPPLFLCPISLDIVSDPVSLPTGITYDGHSIEQWIFNRKHRLYCPVTKQPLPLGTELTPNHTLRRLIQSWCTANGIQQLPAPSLPVDTAHITNLLITGNTELIMASLSSLISNSDSNKPGIKSTPAALDFLASIVNGSDKFNGEALNILYSLQISDQCMLDFISRNGGFIGSLTAILQRSHGPNEQTSRAQATLMLKFIIEYVAPNRMSKLGDELYQGLVQLMHDRVSFMNATKAALKIICLLCRWGRNQIKAVEAGAVPVLIALLIEEEDRRICETLMVLLYRLCRCAEGRAGLVGHAAGIAVVSSKILTVFELASERGVRILHSVLNYSATPVVVKEMLQVGAVCKLCMLVRGDRCGLKTMERVREILRLSEEILRQGVGRILLVFTLICLLYFLRILFKMDICELNIIFNRITSI